ncbi:MAG: hypothetical protein LBF66_03070 [Holosporales bacterium]|nr:hypothetical protein [Holosporales bacterium]
MDAGNSGETERSRNAIHIPPDAPGFLRDQSLVSAGFVPRNVSREPYRSARVLFKTKPADTPLNCTSC